MEIPKSVKIGNSTFAVTPLHEDSTDDYYGRSNTTRDEIKLNFNVGSDHLAETFLHEIIHVICQQHKWSEIDKDEKIVHPLACALYQVLKDNGFLK